MKILTERALYVFKRKQRHALKQTLEQLKMEQAQALEAFEQQLTASPEVAEAYYEQEANTFAYGSQELENRLGITPSERKRWTAEGRLPVLWSDSYPHSGKTIERQHYDFKGIESIQPDDIVAWREHRQNTDEEIMKSARQKGAQTSKESREKNQLAIDSIESYLSTLSASHPTQHQALEVAFWMSETLKWSRVHTAKLWRALGRRHEREQSALEMLTLYESSFSELAKVVPDCLVLENWQESHKVIRDCCDFHFGESLHLSKQQKLPYRKYIDLHREQLLACPNCEVETQEEQAQRYVLRFMGQEGQRLFTLPLQDPARYPMLADLATPSDVKSLSNLSATLPGLVLDEEPIATEFQTKRRLQQSLSKLLESHAV